LALAYVILATCLSAYLIRAGLRMINPEKVKQSRFGLGRIVFGSWILFSQLASHYGVAPSGPWPLMRPENDVQAIGMRDAQVVITVVSILLLASGIKVGLRGQNSEETPDSQVLE